jgi:hypothetical protein
MNLKIFRSRDFISVVFWVWLLTFSLSALADQVVLYNVPSPYGLNWRTPHTLLKTVLRNHASGQSHEIGHVFVGLYCSNLGIAGQADVLTGMTSATDNSEDLLRDQGYGLGILFHNFDGRLNTEAEATFDIQSGVRSGRLSFMAFDVSKATCQRLLTYEMEYRQRGYDQNYGLPNRPLFGEGAGCSAYGVSFLEVAGIDTKLFFRHWVRYLHVPKRLIGGPLTGDFIPLLRILLNPLAIWAGPAEPYFPLGFWDPDRMHGYVGDVMRGAVEMPFGGETLRWGQANGLRMDARAIPTPVGPIFRN